MTTVVAAVISRGQQILVCQRKADGPHALKWEFPGGKVEPGEALEAALKRELEEELEIVSGEVEEITRYEYSYPGKPPILLVFYAVGEFTGEPVNHVFERIEWADRGQVASYDFLEGDRDFISTAFQ